MCVLFLIACRDEGVQSVLVPTNTSEPTATAMPTQTPNLPTQIPLIPPAFTLTPLPPYPTKQVLFLYKISGYHTPTDSFYRDFIATSSVIVLYSDGQMIIPGKPYLQKMLSVDEINQFLTQLDSLGFFAIESNQHHDPTDVLYNFGDQYERVFDGLWYCLISYGEKPRKLCAYEPFMEFLVPKMRNLLEFLDEYQPEGISQYYPDRILLWVQAGRSPYDSNLPENSIPWTQPSLSLGTNREKILYADGELAKELYILYGDKGYIFTQDGKEYTVYMEIVLPHEELTNQYQ